MATVIPTGWYITPCIITSPSVGGTVNMMGYDAHDFVIVYGKMDFADIMKVTYQLTWS